MKIGNGQGISFLIAQNQYISTYIVAADTKASVCLASNIAIIIFCLSVSYVREYIQNAVVLRLFLVCFVISMLLCIFCLAPRTNSSSVSSERGVQYLLANNANLFVLLFFILKELLLYFVDILFLIIGDPCKSIRKDKCVSWVDIVMLSSETEYLQMVQNIDVKSMNIELLKLNYLLSQICAKKQVLGRTSLYFFMLGILLLIFGLLTGSFPSQTPS